jgi:glucose/mannose-6-phosphate isomerase
MRKLVLDFPSQLKQASEIAAAAVLTKHENISNVVITGLGGSGIGGTIVSELTNENCPVPVVVNKDYFLPSFVNQSTLVIVSSYSGNTEETLQAMEMALEKKAIIVAITSGGKVLELAKQHQLEFIQIPGGNPPRSSIGYCLAQLIKVFVVNGLANPSLMIDFNNSITLLEKEQSEIITHSRHIAGLLYNKFPILYSLGSCEGTVVRFRQQINENGKILCGHHSFPEMNHNELVGWTTHNENIAVVTFRTSFDYKRTVKRYEFCKPIFEQYACSVTDIFAKGHSKLEQFFYLIHIGDFISCDIADLRGIDPVEVNVIDKLKKELSNFN